jgi:predicted nucleotidyltransferase/HEPN domain-containing protein
MAAFPQAIPAPRQSGPENSIQPEQVGELIRRLVEAYEPVRIVAFGSWARGEHGPESDLDLAVIVDDDRGPDQRRKAPYSLAGLDLSPDILVNTVSMHRRYASVVGNLYHAIATQGVVLYDRGMRGSMAAFYPEPSEEEHLRSKVEILQGLVKKASKDERALNAAGLDHEIYGFHGQQALEKMCKVWLISVDAVPPHTHSLNKLKEKFEDSGLKWPRIDVNLDHLSEYAGEWRYTPIEEGKMVDINTLRKDVARTRERLVAGLTEKGLLAEP